MSFSNLGWNFANCKNVRFITSVHCWNWQFCDVNALYTLTMAEFMALL